MAEDGLLTGRRSVDRWDTTFERRFETPVDQDDLTGVQLEGGQCVEGGEESTGGLRISTSSSAR